MFEGLRTRRLAPTHEVWHPHPYQERGMQFLQEVATSALFYDPGLGKTSVVLQAFKDLKEKGAVNTMLVVAPLRVCQLVWRQEGKKWTQFRDLKFSLIHGPGRAKKMALGVKADIYLINPEGIAWLSQQFFGRKMPFDVICIDELTKFKNAQAKRSKVLRPHAANARYVWGLTGTPSPNGYMDLFGQFLLLDNGRSLGPYITHFRDKYFQKGWDGFTYELLPDGAAAIEKRIKPLVLRMAAKDWLKLPKFVDDVRSISMSPKDKKAYDVLAEQMIVELEGDVITAANSAAVYSKLAQMANGAVYATPDPTKPKEKNRKVIHIHDAKLDALEELIEELCGEPLLISYEFQHDLERMKERFGKDMPVLGAGMSAQQTMRIEAAWNEGKLPFMAAHPASVGHGLNLQKGNASHICQFGITWDFELYDQFLKRILRQGNKTRRVVNHILAVEGTVDFLKLDALAEKDMSQGKLLDNLSDFVNIKPTQGEPEMSRLPTKASMKKPIKVKGWGASDDDAQEAEAPTTKLKIKRPAPEGDEQRDEIQDKLQATNREDQEEAPVDAGGLFSDEVRQALQGDSEEDKPAPKKKDAAKKPSAAQKKAAAKAMADMKAENEASAAPSEINYRKLAAAVIEEVLERLQK